MELKHTEEGNKGRFTFWVDGKEAGFIKYDILPNHNLLANGTLVHDEFKSLRLGGQLFDTLIAYAREKNVKIYPTCPYVVKMFEKHGELAALLATDYKK